MLRLGAASGDDTCSLRYIDFIFAPFRAINNKILGVKNIKGNIKVDVNRAKALGKRGKNFAART